MKLQELRAQVYTLAGVSITRQLKAQYQEIRSLDMRRTTSWEKALAIVQPPPDLQDWLENPPDEYKALFADIEATAKAFDLKLIEARQLSEEVSGLADSLEDLASGCQDEAELLTQEVTAARRVAKQARMN